MHMCMYICAHRIFVRREVSKSNQSSGPDCGGEAVLDPKGISDLTSEGRDRTMESVQGHPAGPTVAIREGFLREKDLSWTRK